MGACCTKKRDQDYFNIKFSDSTSKDPKKLETGLEDEPHILIVGAGVAGLSCAVELLRNKFKRVTIFEASNRIGGRIYSVQLGEGYVDLGAQWVHGQDKNVVYEDVYKLSMLDSAATHFANAEWIRSTGDKMPDETMRLLMQTMAKIFDNRYKDIHLYDGAFSSYLDEKFEEELQMGKLAHIERSLALEFLESFKRMEGTSTAAGVDEMACTSFEIFEECPGDPMLNWRRKGFRQYLMYLVEGNDSNELGILRDRIQFNTKVVKIEWDNADGLIVVNCSNGHDYKVDHVIMTVSLGVLKRNLSLFQPLLPVDKRRAINFMGFGQVCKIFIEFETPFWQPGWSGFTAIWTKDTIEEYESMKLDWICDIYGFYCVAHQPRILQAWATGPNVEIIESINSAELRKGIMQMLRHFIVNLNVPEPKKIVTSKFSTDPDFLGSYSYLSLLTKRYFTGPEELMHPINVMGYLPLDSNSNESLTPMTVRPVILFAGEATSPNHFSTVHGAVESGRREALRLSGYYWK